MKTIIETIQSRQLFHPWFSDKSWSSWIIFLKALFGLSLNKSDLETFSKHTKRQSPSGPYREGWVIVGRRGGKSLIADLVAVYLACFRDYAKYLKPGEVATLAVICADRKQARTILRYVRGFLALPILRRLVLNDTLESIELSTRVSIEVHTASFRSTRGYTFCAVILDEAAFFRTDDSANPDSEIIAAVRPGLATIPNSLLLVISSPYARRGSLWTAYERYFGKDDATTLVWQAASREMNPSLPQSVVDQAYAEDEASAAAEYGAQFRRDIESFVSREAVEAVVIKGRLELSPVRGVAYFAFVDPSGGSADSMTLAVAHAEATKVVLDLVRETKPPFSPEAVVVDFAETLKTYGVTRVTGDRYAGEWPREQFRKAGVSYVVADKTKAEIYLAALPLLNSQRVELLDNPRLLAQLIGLERRTSRAGKDSIDHAPSSHDDLINAAAGALTLAVVPTASLVHDGLIVGSPIPREFQVPQINWKEQIF